jgi:ABC-type sugar transport system ATPase subunit
MLEVMGLSARAGSFVLSNVSLKVPPSSCHVILGPTGSGKTLLLESVIGLRKPDKGNILLNGDEITYFPIEKRKLSYVPQDLALFPHMTVRENILYPIRIRGITQDTQNGIVRELVDSLGMRRLLDRQIRNLSGGERQRTALARAVVSGCKHLVLDEPLSALHESLKKELWYLLKNLQRRYGLAILMVTHDLEEAFFLGDTISIIIDGRLHQQGSKGDVYGRPATVEVAQFLGIGNLFRGAVESNTRGPFSVYCEDIGATLRLPAHSVTATAAENASLVVGIRSEDVSILMPGDQLPSENNVIHGTIRDVFENGASWTIIATCGPSSTSLEVIVPRGMSRKLNASKGKSVVLRLPEEHVFLIQ